MYLYQVLRTADDGAQSIKVISDNTDVFVLLVHVCSEKELGCRLLMEATSSERMTVDIKATVQNCKTIVPYLFCDLPIGDSGQSFQGQIDTHVQTGSIYLRIIPLILNRF